MGSDKQMFSRLCGRIKSVKSDTIIALILTVTVSVIAYIFLGFAKNGIDSLYLYAGGDDTTLLSTIKRIMQTGWTWENYRIGYPFEDPNSIFAFSGLFLSNADTALMWIITRFVDDVAIAANLFRISIIAIISLNSYIVFRAIKLNKISSVFGSVMFAFTPYIFFRIGFHTTLATAYFVPFSILLCVWAFDNDDKYLKLDRNFFKSHKNIATVIFTILIANNGIGYYPVFTCFFLCVVIICKIFSDKKISTVIPAIKTIVLIIFFFLLALLPYIIYSATNEVPYSTERPLSDMELYALKISQMFIPLHSHNIYLIENIQIAYDNSMIHINENRGAYLGIAGIIGFLLSLIVLMFSKKPKSEQDKVLFLMSRLSICGVLLGTWGGFNVLIGFVFNMIRAYNRISIFISFICITVICIFLHRFVEYIKNKKINIKIISTTCLIAFSGICLWDTLPPLGAGDNAIIDYTSTYNSDKLFVQNIEEQLGENAAVFQLPYHPYPESGSNGGMVDYHHFIGFIHSDTLNWIYGTGKGGNIDQWYRTVANMPVPEMIDTICKAGFTGIYIDTRAFSSVELEYLTMTIKEVTNSEPLISDNGNLMFYNLNPYIAQNNVSVDESVLEIDVINCLPSYLSVAGGAEKHYNKIILHPGSVQHGPYCSIDQGDYIVTVEGENLNKAKFDVCYAGGTKLIAINELIRSEDKCVYTFSTNEKLSSVEFRAFNSSGEIINISHITVTPSDDLEADTLHQLANTGIECIYDLEDLSIIGNSEKTEDEIVLHSSSTQFGPYSSFVAGTYTVTITGQNLDMASFDVSNEAGTNFFEYTVLVHTDDEIVYEVTFVENENKVEFRTFNNSTEDIVIDQIEVLGNAA